MSPWPKNLALRTLVFLWSLPKAVIGLLVLLLAVITFRKPSCWFQAGVLVTYIERWPGTYMRREKWGGFALSWVVIVWQKPPSWALLFHETRHTIQTFFFGIFWLPIYGILHLIYGYADNPFEIEARNKTYKWLTQKE